MQQALASAYAAATDTLFLKKKSHCALLNISEEVSLLANNFYFPAIAKSARGREFGKKISVLP